jgi:hypothetical protein
MKRVVVFISLIILFSCSNNSTKEESESTTSQVSQSQNLLNITILLDLSDRLEQNLQPNQKERDLEIISNVISVFKDNMESNGAFNAKDKLKVLFRPIPNDPNINNIARKLSIDLSEEDLKNKKDIYDNIENNFREGLNEIYNLTLDSKNYIGSDIWRFFKNDIADFCIERDSTYKNVLVIITDGYVYHEQSVDRSENRTAFITGKYFQSEGFRDNMNWKEKFNSEDYGLISFSDFNLSDINVLVLEINPSESHRNDEDIIKEYWSKWLTEMNIQNFSIYNTELPENTKKRIENFFRD